MEAGRGWNAALAEHSPAVCAFQCEFETRTPDEWLRAPAGEVESRGRGAACLPIVRVGAGRCRRGDEHPASLSVTMTLSAKLHSAVIHSLAPTTALIHAGAPSISDGAPARFCHLCATALLDRLTGKESR